MSDLVFQAMLFAADKHANQVRKYTGEPYFSHLAEVAGITATVLGHDEVALAAAWLHDCVEDQSVTFEQLEHKFGIAIATGVFALSDLAVGNRAERNAASRARLAGETGYIQTIKCADVISNVRSIRKHDAKFAAVYIPEKLAMLDVLSQADPNLRVYAYLVCRGE